MAAAVHSRFVALDSVKSLTTPPYEFVLPSQSGLPVRRRAYLIKMGVNANESRNLRLNLAVSSAERARALLRDKLSVDFQDVIEKQLYSDYGVSNQVQPNTASKADLKAVLDLLAGRPVSEALRNEVDPEHKLQAATPDDAVVLYIASHGYADPQATFYSCPTTQAPTGGSPKIS